MAAWFHWRNSRFPLLKHLDEVLDLRSNAIDICVMEEYLFSTLVKNEFTTIIKVRLIGHDQVTRFDFLFIACTDTCHRREARSGRFKEWLEVETCFYGTIGRQPGDLECQ